MNFFDDHMLTEVGLADLSPARREKLCQRMDHVLTLRVGEALLNAMWDDSLREIGVLLQEGAPIDARQSFDHTVKSCAGVISQERDRIRVSLREASDKLRAADS